MEITIGFPEPEFTVGNKLYNFSLTCWPRAYLNLVDKWIPKWVAFKISLDLVAKAERF